MTIRVEQATAPTVKVRALIGELDAESGPTGNRTFELLDLLSGSRHHNRH